MTSTDDPMYRDTAASPELAETPVKLPADEQKPKPTEEEKAANHGNEPSV